MYAKRDLASLVVGCALLVVTGGAVGGCDRDSKPKATTTTPPPVPSVEDVATTRDKAIAAAKAATQKSAGAMSDAGAAAGDMAAKTKEQGAELLGKIDASIKANRLDEAQTYVDAFDRMKANVPDDLKARYDSLKAQLKAARDKATGQPAAAPAPAEPNK